MTFPQNWPSGTPHPGVRGVGEEMRKNQCPAQGPWEDPLLSSRALSGCFPPFSEHHQRKSGWREPLHQVAPVSRPGAVPRPAAPLTAALALPDLSSRSLPGHRALAREKSSGTQGPDQRQKALRDGAPCAAPGSSWKASSPCAEASPPRPSEKRLQGDRPSRLRPRRALWPHRGRNPGGSAI